MFRRIALTVCLVIACIWCLAIVAEAEGVNFRPVSLPIALPG